MALKRLMLRRGGDGKRKAREQAESEALRQDLDDVVCKLNSFSKDLKAELERVRIGPEKEE